PDAIVLFRMGDFYETFEEDKIIQEYRLNAKPENFRIMSVDEVFEK
ncbi:MutS domain I, partial [Candidatus Kryptonium thompsonii]